jgi:sRNA-binding carbon storage regulator CsrA
VTASWRPIAFRQAWRLARYPAVDPYQTRCHVAMDLVDQCDRLMLMGDFLLAQENCKQALLMVPGYSHALRVRGNVLREYVGMAAAGLSRDRKLAFLNQASEDIVQYAKAVPDDPWGVIDACWTGIAIKGKQVKLGFEADNDVLVHRSEVWERIQAGRRPDGKNRRGVKLPATRQSAEPAR